MNTKSIVAIAVGAALFAVLSPIAIPVGPNTSFKVAYIALIIFAVYYGPVVGFLSGFIGHTLADAVQYGEVWFGWVFYSAFLAGIIGMAFYNIKIGEGKIDTKSIITLYVYGLLGLLGGSAAAFIGDVFVYGEPANKVLVQLGIAGLSNAVVVFVVAFPIIIGWTKYNQKTRGFDSEQTS